MHAAAALLKAGWVVEYRADAAVEHSHDYTTRQEFQRYFDVGVMIARSRLLAGDFGGPTGEGAAHVRQQIAYLAREAPHLIPLALWRAAVSMAAYTLGRHEAALPLALKRRLGVNRRFWPAAAQSRHAAIEPAVLRRLET
jgi:rhamnosyltransferase